MPRGIYERTAEYRAKLSAAHPKSYPPEFGAKVSAGKRQATCRRGHDLTDPANDVNRRYIESDEWLCESQA